MKEALADAERKQEESRKELSGKDFAFQQLIEKSRDYLGAIEQRKRQLHLKLKVEVDKTGLLTSVHAKLAVTDNLSL